MSLKTTGYVLDILFLAGQHEAVLQELYEVFAARIPDQRPFWLKLASDEASHVIIMKTLEEYAKKDLLHSHPDCRLDPQQIRCDIGHLGLYLDDLRDHEVSPRRATAIAKEAEESLLERRFDTFLDTDDEGVRRLLREFHEGTERHCRELDRLAARRDEYSGLVESRIVSNIQVELARALGHKENISTESVLMSRFHVGKGKILESFESFYKTGVFEFGGNVSIPPNVLRAVRDRYEDLKARLFMPVAVEDGQVVIAMANPRDIVLRDDIERLFGDTVVQFRVATCDDILAAVDSVFRRDVQPKGDELRGLLDQLGREQAAALELQKSRDDETVREDTTIVKFVTRIIEEAFEQGASDVHIEPSPDRDGLIRCRVDGLVRKMAECPNRSSSAIITRIKIMAGLDIAEHRKPQSGKIQFRRWGRLDIELRVETYPTTGNTEDAVLRILPPGKPKPLPSLGLTEKNLELVKKIVFQPYGLFLSVGPTGSGKTTTLHSALDHINNDTVKIVTVEDPVEITQPGLRQVQVNRKAGLTFEAVLRSFLRADPDVIMIGEMRDLETASIAIEASLTGHLVLSTLHTNTAPETVSRLLDIGLDPYSFADSLLGVLAQRLMRTLCPTCKKPTARKEEVLDTLRREYGRPDVFEGLAGEPDVALFERSPSGCEECGLSGFKGRTAIHEFLVADDGLRGLITRKATVADIRGAATSGGMWSLMQDGIQKVLKGITTMEEVRAVCSR